MSDYGLDSEQFRQFVIRPTLQKLELWSPAAESLVVGTAYQESELRYLHQLSGPAYGLFQMEPATYADIWRSFLAYRHELYLKVARLAAPFNTDVPAAEEMIGNLFYATALCRVHYLRVRARLPDADNPAAMTAYYLSYYNSELGKATFDEAFPHFQRAVAESL